MIERTRAIQAAIALAVVALISVIAQLVLVDADHVESPIWAADVLGTWPAIALASTIALVGVAYAAARSGLLRETDPYAQVVDEPEPEPAHPPEEAQP